MNNNFSNSDVHNLLVSQKEAKRIALKIAEGVVPGMDEWDVHSLTKEVFHKNGVSRHWHFPYIGLGPGTNKLKSTFALSKSFFQMKRKLKNNDLIMIDIAPVIEGYPSDYTVSSVVGMNAEYSAQVAYTKKVALNVLQLVENGLSNQQIFKATQTSVKQSEKYLLGDVPFIKLGHRLLKVPDWVGSFPEARFAYLLGYPGAAFINGRWSSTLDNLWAVEPYILSATRGTKYEELVYIEGNGVVHRLNPVDDMV